MRDRLNHLIRNLLPTHAALSPQQRLVEDLGLDSLKVMELISTVEDELGISISLRSLYGVSTVADLHRLVDEHLRQA